MVGQNLVWEDRRRWGGEGSRRLGDGHRRSKPTLGPLDGLGLEKSGELRVGARVAGPVKIPTMQGTVGTPVPTPTRSL